MKQDPLVKFKIWWDQAKENSPLNQSSAACLSTINEDGYPSGRFVDLKDLKDGCFVICTSLKSTKARELLKNPKTSLTIWWDHIGRQVRITGTAEMMPGDASIKYWEERPQEAHMVSVCSRQSDVISDLKNLEAEIAQFKKSLDEGSEIPKPEQWGCFNIKPTQIEFLTFHDNRFHIRELFTLENEHWQRTFLQP